MKNLFHPLFVALTVALSLAGCATSAPPVRTAPRVTNGTATPGHTPLLLISIDAYRYDYIQRGLSPTLSMLAQGGVQAASMQPSFPSLTFPNHYTLVTGLSPDHHGIVHNDMFDPTLGHFSLSNRKAVQDGRWWDEATPIWETADRHGLRTGTMFWPGSEADIHGMHPDYWMPFSDKVTPDQRVDKVLSWLDLPLSKRPTFLTLYFDAVDHAGHEFGPDTPQLDDTLRSTDAAMARLVRGLKQRGLFNHMDIIVVSDHGMAHVPLANSIVIDTLIPLNQVQTVSMGVLAGFNPKSSSAASQHEFAAVERTLEQPQKHMRCWDKTRVPKRLVYGSNARVPQLICLAGVGWRISTAAYLQQHHGHIKLGEHGYDNADPRMQAVFVAHGPDFRVGAKVGAFPNVDVYPLMTHLLHIPARPNDGSYKAVEDMLRPGER